VETNIHGGDLLEIDKNDRTQKIVAEEKPKELQKTVVGLKKIVIKFKKCPVFFQN
jgi:hypothetical protein